jgi:hypothetical protein
MKGPAASAGACCGRRLGRLSAGAVAFLTITVALPAPAQPIPAQPIAAQPIPSGRGDVLLRRDCRSMIARQEVTLFGNGTVRLRSGPLGEERMLLIEVTRDEVESLVAALRGEDFTEAGAGSAGPEGDWVERCLLELPVLAAAPAGEGGGGSSAVGGGGRDAGEAGSPDAAATRPDPPLGPGGASGDHPATRFAYGRLDSLSLPLARVVALVDGLAQRVEAGAGAGRLPPGYRPRQGDVLRRADGVLFRVVRATAALEVMPGGWELQGVVQPLAVYVLEADLPREFGELVSRDEVYGP